MPLAARAWQQGRLWVNDPDCVVARPSYAQRERWADAATRLGGLRSFSDRVAELDDWGLATVRELLADGGSRDPAPIADGCARRPGSRRTRARRDRAGHGRADDAHRAVRRSSSTPTSTAQVCARPGRAGRAVRRPAGRPPRRAADRTDRLPDHLRRRHPSPGEAPLHTLAGFLRRPRRRRGQRRAPAADVPVDLRRRFRRGRPPRRSTRPWAPGPTWPSWPADHALMFDFVANHTSSSSPWFTRLAGRATRATPASTSSGTPTSTTRTWSGRAPRRCTTPFARPDGTKAWAWTTFGEDQVDVDVRTRGPCSS